MSIKAKTVQKGRAAAFDRGQFTDATAATASAPKRSYYYAEERRSEACDAAPTTGSSSSSSRSSSCSACPPHTGATTSCANTAAASGQGDDEADMSDDEEVVRRARAATQALLGEGTRPASAMAKSVASSVNAVPNSRLEAYLRGRAGSAPTACTLDLPTASPQLTSATFLQSDCVTSGLLQPNAPAKQRAPSAISPQSVATQGTETGTSHTQDQILTPDDSKATEASATLQEALRMHTTNSDFQQLMSLFADDVRREQQQQREQEAGKAKPGLPVAGAMLSEADPLSGSHGLKASSTSFCTAAAASAKQRPPTPRPCMFAALEDAALERLFNEWCHRNATTSNADDDDAAADNAAVFIAADHRAAAFTLAAVAARDLDFSPWGRQAEPGGAGPAAVGVAPSPSSSPFAPVPVANAPLTWEELMLGEVARRNARSFHYSGGGLLSNPEGIAEQATQQLRRFFQAVDCIERLVSNRRFMRSVAAFLYEHHRIFLPHYKQSLTPSLLPEPTSAPGSTSPAPSLAAEHCHEEYAVYEEFGQRVSTTLLSLLSHNVEDFNEAEFVEALYDTPAAFADGDVPSEAAVKGPQNVLSFPAWRLVLAMSDFEGFFAWMMDYVYEEYHLDSLEEKGAKVAVAGARGLRAQIRSTYNRPVEDASASVTGTESTRPPASAASPGGDAALSPLMASGSPSPPPDLLHAASPLTSQNSSDLSLRPKGALAPLPSGMLLQPAPPPSSCRDLSSATIAIGHGGGGGIPTGVHLRQFFPSPPASAEGGTRPSAAGNKAAPVYRKRQTTHPGRTLPPITLTTDTVVRPGSTDAAVGSLNSSASLPAPLRLSDADGADGHAARTFASTAPPAASVVTPASAPTSALTRWPTRTRSSTAKKNAVTAEGTAPRRGSQTQKPKSRTSSSMRTVAGEPPKVKSQRSKLKR